MEPFIGQVTLFAGSYAPRGWAFCQGQVLTIASNQTLYAIIGNIYGGDGRTSFALPNLTGRVPVQQGHASGLSMVSLGRMYGSEQVVLNQSQLPAHSHIASITDAHATVQIPALDDAADSATAGGNGILATGEDTNGDEVKLYNNSDSADSSLAPFAASVTGNVQISDTGSNFPVSVIQPSLGMNYIIALEGTFPPRS